MKCVGDSGCQRNSTFSALLYSARLIIPTCLREEQRWSRDGEELRSNTSSLLHLYSVSALFFVHFLQKTNEQSSDETALQTHTYRSTQKPYCNSSCFCCVQLLTYGNCTTGRLPSVGLEEEGSPPQRVQRFPDIGKK